MLGADALAPSPKSGRVRRRRGRLRVVSTVVPGLVRSDESASEVHPVARPESRPPTDVRGDRDGEHRGHDVPPLSSVRIAGHRDRRLQQVLRREGGARGSTRWSCAPSNRAPPERIPHAQQFAAPSERPPLQRRGRDREARYADLPELDSGSLMQNPSRRNHGVVRSLPDYPTAGDQIGRQAAGRMSGSPPQARDDGMLDITADGTDQGLRRDPRCR